MRLDRLHLTNFGPHADRTFEFGPGLNAIVGVNGSGKSSLLAAVHGILTNDFRLPGTNEDNVRWQAGPNARCHLGLEFEHGGKACIAERTLSPRPGRKLVVDGGEPVTAERAFQAALAALLAVPKEILSDHVFVPQWGIFDFLDLTEARRDALCAKLFDMDRLTRAYGAVNNRLLRPQQVPADLRPMLVRANSLEIEQADLASEIQCLSSAGTQNCDSVDAELMKQAEASFRADQAYRETSANRAHAQANCLSAETGLKAAQQASDAVAAASPTAEAVDEAKAAEAGWTAHRQSLSVLESLKASLGRFEADLARPQPTPPAGYRQGGQSAPLIEMEAKAASLRSFVQHLEKLASSPTCPTCGQAAGHLTERLPDAKKELAELNVEIPRLRRAMEDAAAYERALDGWVHSQSHSTQQSAEVAERIKSWVVAAPPSIDQAAAARLLGEAMTCAGYSSRASAALASARERTAAAVAFSEAAVKAENAAVAEQDRLSVLLAGRPAREVYDAARDRMAERNRVRERAATLGGRAEEISRSLAAAMADLDAAKAKAAQGLVDQSWRERLRPPHDLLSRDSLPRIYAKACLDSLATEVNSCLAEFAAPFRVAVDASLAFAADFGDGIVGPASRLSGGQKVVLALAVRLAILLRFAAGVGLLCLDEPSAGLDKNNLRVVGTALDRLRRLGAAGHLQVLVVTHDVDLGHMFDRVIAV